MVQSPGSIYVEVSPVPSREHPVSGLGAGLGAGAPLLFPPALDNCNNNKNTAQLFPVRLGFQM